MPTSPQVLRSGRAEAAHVAPGPLDRLLLRWLRRALGDPPFRFVLWNGEVLPAASAASPRVTLHLRDARLPRQLLHSPELTLGEAYADGRIEVDGDLVAAVEAAFEACRDRPRWAELLSDVLAWAPRWNTERRARQNVHHHYDLGNDFYRLWLDRRLLYTCAYFGRPEMTLEEAQVAKMDHVCRKLRLRPGDRVVEAGCGWGALALHMVERYGVTVRAFNVSVQQIRHAREEAERRGLADRVEFLDQDYRSITGACDVFVSVGMLEHVGRAHYGRLARVIDRCLAPEGRGLLHFIGHLSPIPMNPWLERNIFPGAYIPALSEVLPALEAAGLEVQDVENLRRHYGLTLETWLERFEASADRVRRMYDERFVRMWRLYLASSIASFRCGASLLYQVVFTRPGGDGAARLPWTRDDLYAGK